MTVDLPQPPARIVTPIPADVRAALLDAVRRTPPAQPALQWLEKVRRFASYSGRHLGMVAANRFGSEADSQLGWMIRFLAEGGAFHPDRGAAPVDAACLSGARYCFDAMRHPAPDCEKVLTQAEDEIRSALLGLNRVDAPPSVGELYDCDLGPWREEASACDQLILFSPNPYSLYSIAVLELCLRYRLPVAAVVLRSFSLARAAEEWKRDGLRLPRKIWRKLVLRADENATSDGLSTKKLVNQLSPRHRDIRKTARANGIPVLLASRFQDLEGLLRPFRPELALFTGGGLINPSTINCFSRGIINVHLGLLPHYKGMDVVEAPLLEGRRTVGAAAHLMVPKLDSGPVLLKFEAEVEACSSLGAIRNSLGCMAPLLMLDSALGLCSGRLAAIEQPATGRQFFIVHPRLRILLQQVLETRTGHSSPAGARLQECLATSVGSLAPAA